MTYRNLFLNTIIALLCCFYSPMVRAGMPNLQDLERELAEANKAIEEYVSSLSPEEQAEFNRAVDEMSQVFENMSEEDFEKFLGEMFADETMMAEPSPFDVIPPTQPEIVEEVVLSAEEKKKVETALAIIDDIIKQSNLFMVIVNSSSDLPNRITQWTKKGKISNWKEEANWETFKLEIERFVQKLYRVEEQDLTTKKYKYLLELIADEGLYNNLIQLQTSLKSLMPTINIPEFNIQKLSEESKEAIQNILAKYTESFYLLDIPKALDTLFEKYAPEEEKIRLSEEEATRRALEASKMGKIPAAQTEAGTAYPGYGEYGGYNYPSYDYGYNYPSYDYGYNYPSEYARGGGAGKAPSGKGGGGGVGGGGAKKEGEKEKKEEEEKEKEKKGKEKFTPNYELDTALNDIKLSLKDITTAMSKEEENPTKLSNLVEHIKNNQEPVDEALAGYILPTVVDKKIAMIDDAVKKIDAKKLNAEDLAHYQKEVKKVFDANKKDLTDLVDAIDTFATHKDVTEAEARAQKNISIASKKRTDIDKLPAAKRWAYFGGNESLLKGEDLKLKEKIPAPVSLFEIKDRINKLFADVDKFTRKKEKAPAAPPAPAKKPEAAPAEIPPIPEPPAEEVFVPGEVQPLAPIEVE